MDVSGYVWGGGSWRVGRMRWTGDAYREYELTDSVGLSRS